MFQGAVDNAMYYYPRLLGQCNLCFMLSMALWVMVLTILPNSNEILLGQTGKQKVLSIICLIGVELNAASTVCHVNRPVSK